MSEENSEKKEQGQGQDEARQRAELDHLINEATGDGAGIEGEWQPGADQGGQGPQPGPKTAEVIEPLLLITFGIVAARKGQHWALQPAEAKEAAGAYADVLDKYAPDVAVGPELTALLVTAMIVAPRMGEDKRQAAARARDEKQSGGGDGDQAE